nr:diguanylate cyclase [Thioclava electrotropha]
MARLLGRVRRQFVLVAIFAAFINLLVLAGPLFMLQVYDRVLPARSLPTLINLFLLVAFLFTAIMHAVNEAGRVFAQNLLRQLTEPFSLAGNSVVLTASLGIALYPVNGLEPEALMRNAEAAMTHAKRQGRNRYQFYASDIDSKSKKRLAEGGPLRRSPRRAETTPPPSEQPRPKRRRLVMPKGNGWN